MPYIVFHPKIVFYNIFSYFSVGVDSRPGRFFWHQYGSNWMLYYTAADKNHRGMFCCKISSSDTVAMQQRFLQKQCTWWKDNSTFGAKFRKTGIGTDVNKDQHHSFFSIIPENIQNLQDIMRNLPENQHAVSHKKLAFLQIHFWGSSMMTLSSFLTKFRSCRGKLIKIKQNKKHFVKISFNRLKMTVACWILTIWMMSTTAAFVGHLLHFLFPEIWPPNAELSFYQVHCSCQNLFCIVTVSEELILWQSMPWWFLSPAM